MVVPEAIPDPDTLQEPTSGPFRALMILAFIIGLVASVPSTSVYYAAPVLALMCYIGHPRVFARLLVMVLAVFTLAAMALGFDAMRGVHTNPAGVVVGCVTYAPWLMLFALRPAAEGPVPDSMWKGFISVVAYFVLCQSAIGLFQYATTRAPDMVSGTFGLVNYLAGRITISQVFFTFTMFVCLLLLACYSKSWLNRMALVAGTGTVLAAQSAHQTIFLLAAVPTMMAIAYRKFGLAVKGIVVVSVGAVAMQIVNPTTYDSAKTWWDKVMVSDHSLKRHMVFAAGRAFKSPKNVVLGTGLGQFSSRAALISSGDYTVSRLPRWIKGSSDYYRDGVAVELPLFKEIGENSAMAQPFCSAISFTVEFGIPVTLLLLCFIWRVIMRNGRRARAGGESGRLAVAINIGVLFFLLCCFIENYAEFGQALIIPMMFLLLASRRIDHLEALAEVEEAKQAQEALPSEQVLQPGL